MITMQRARLVILIAGLLVAVGVLMAFRTPTRTALDASPWSRSWSERDVECELRSGCHQLVGMIAEGSPDSAWAVDRLEVAIRTPELGADVHAIARRGLALAKR